jgi:hypothetical protein
VFENKALRRIFRPNRQEITGGSIKLHNEEHHNLYSSPMKRVRYVVRMRAMRKACRDWRIILKWIFEKWGGKWRT